MSLCLLIPVGLGGSGGRRTPSSQQGLVVLWLGPAGERQVSLGGHSILVFLSGLELFSEKRPETPAPLSAPRFTLSSQPSPSTGSWGYKCFIT